MMRFGRKFVIVTITVVLALAAGVALAAWVASGSGSGYVTAVNAQHLTTVDASASTVTQLYPGGSGDVVVRIVNPNAYPVTVTAITATAPITTKPPNAACNASTGVTFTNQAGLSLSVPANNGPAGTLFTLTGAAHMSNATVDACQGKTFKIPVSMTGTS